MKNPKTSGDICGQSRIQGTVSKSSNIYTPTHHTPQNWFPPTTNPNQTDNSVAEGIITVTARQKNPRQWTYDSLDEGQGKTKIFFYIGNQEVKIWGITSRNITHHITIGKCVLLICICKMPYLISIII